MTYVFHFADVKVPMKAPVLSTMIQKQSKVVEFNGWSKKNLFCLMVDGDSSSC